MNKFISVMITMPMSLAGMYLILMEMATMMVTMVRVGLDHTDVIVNILNLICLMWLTLRVTLRWLVHLLQRGKRSEKNDKPLPPITSASKRATPPRKSTLG